MEERIWLLLARKMAGELAADASDELEIFLINNPAIARQADIITALWKQPNYHLVRIISIAPVFKYTVFAEEI